MQRKGSKRPNNFFSSGLIIIVIFLALLGVVNFFSSGGNSAASEEINQSEFIQKLKDKEIETVQIKPRAGAYEITGKYREDKEGSESSTSNNIPILNNTELDQAKGFIVHVLPNDSTLSAINQAAEDSGTEVVAQEEDQTNMWISLIMSAIPLIFFVFIMYMMFSQTQGGGRNNPMQMGKSRVEDVSKKSRVKFSDVAGCEEEKEELVELVDFLRAPKKYHDIGARIPKGVLLEGPPGTGKTLLAKAVAGEANVPFYSISGSEFVEMFVGVGASRVRDLFDTAKKNSPAIIFIDEIDAVGRQRGAASGSGGHDEREQTLNQLLVEMDGFEEKDNVIVIAATNRSDVLDPALLRPGRFDRQILVGRPDVKGREAILKVHARNKPLAQNVDLKVIAQQTPGFTGAELENVLNEAALLAARLDKKRIEMVDVDEAQDRVIAGPAKPNSQPSLEERRVTAFHEAGHTVCGMVLSDARVVHKVTIVPRGKAGGYAVMLPKEDQTMHSKKNLHEQIVGLLGGRASEEIFFDTQTTGASNDFEQATSLARSMITEYGMSEELGPISYEGNHSMRGTNPYQQKSYSGETAAKIDQELRKVMDQALEEAKDILSQHKEQVRVIAEHLLKLETLNAKQIKSLFENGRLPEDDESQESGHENEPISYEEAKENLKKSQIERQKKVQEEVDDSKEETISSPEEDRHEDDSNETQHDDASPQESNDDDQE